VDVVETMVVVEEKKKKYGIDHVIAGIIYPVCLIRIIGL